MGRFVTPANPGSWSGAGTGVQVLLRRLDSGIRRNDGAQAPYCQVERIVTHISGRSLSSLSESSRPYRAFTVKDCSARTWAVVAVPLLHILMFVSGLPFPLSPANTTTARTSSTAALYHGHLQMRVLINPS